MKNKIKNTLILLKDENNKKAEEFLFGRKSK